MSVLKFSKWFNLDGTAKAAEVNSQGLVTFDNAVAQPIPIFDGSNSTQSVTTSTYVLMQIANIQIDNYSWFNSSNRQYTPQIAGWYEITLLGTGTSASNNITALIPSIYINGSPASARVYRCPSANNMSGYVNYIKYFNGTTDYVSWYFWVNGTSPTAQGYVTVKLLKIGA